MAASRSDQARRSQLRRLEIEIAWLKWSVLIAASLIVSLCNLGFVWLEDDNELIHGFAATGDLSVRGWTTVYVLGLTTGPPMLAYAYLGQASTRLRWLGGFQLVLTIIALVALGQLGEVEYDEIRFGFWLAFVLPFTTMSLAFAAAGDLKKHDQR